MKITGLTRYCAVLGHPIGHTLSPTMHNAAFQHLGMEAAYLAFDCKPNKIVSILSTLLDVGFVGVNLTIPLKEIAFRHLTALDHSAKVAGAVNTINFSTEQMVGYSTDGYGFLRAYSDAFGCGIDGSNVFVLGTGGGGRTVALTCAQSGAKSLTLADLDHDRAQRVMEEIEQINNRVPVRIVSAELDITAAARESDVLVQATPVGMKKDDKSPLNSHAFRAEQKVYDLIYMYEETGFLREARLAGARGANGLGMLLHQGAQSFKIWWGQEAPLEVMRQALLQAIKSK